MADQRDREVQAVLERLRDPATAGQELSDDALRALLDYALERRYLEELSAVESFGKPVSARRSITWVKVNRLPVHPSQIEDYNLLQRWPSVLSTLHAWGHRLIFLLQRYQGETHLYLGAISSTGLIDATSAAAQLCQAASSQMPGIELLPLSKEDAIEQITVPITSLQAAGAVTGLPSLRQGNDKLLQTLDQLAFGIRDFSSDDQDYSLVVIADPVADREIAQSIHALRLLGSRLHSLAKRTVSTTDGTQNARTIGADLGVIFGTLMSFVPGGVGQVASLLQMFGLIPSINFSKTTAKLHSETRGFEQIDKLAQYCEELTDKHVQRLKQGRNLGLWNAGVYVLADSETTVTTIDGILRSIYSGEESYLEPIRVHLLSRHSGAAQIIRQFQHLPLPTEARGDNASTDSAWHPMGSAYETATTVLNTEELSIATSLPRRDVPGLRFVRNAVRFATNPPPLAANADRIEIGQVMDTGVILDRSYAFDLNTLVKHVLVTGVTGSGKSTTCRRLLGEVIARKKPTLIIEPAKDEYVRWAIEHNRTAPEGDRFHIFMPGAQEFEGTPLEQLHLNPFEPAGVAGAPVDFAARYERFSALLTASLPMSDVLPLLMEEAIYRYMQNQIDLGFGDGELSPMKSYPKLEGLIETAKQIVKSRGYESRVQDNLAAAIQTRIGALTRGKRGKVLNTPKSTDFAVLFEQPTIVNLSLIADDRDKALIMALLLIALFEYRQSKYRHDPDYRQAAQDNQLCHLVVVEEAHRLLKNPAQDVSGIGNPQAVAATMFAEMLAEIRAYGQGLLLVDQVPSKLIPDAIKNTNCKIVHRMVAQDDRAIMASCMALRPDQQDVIAVLSRGQAIVCSDDDDAASWIKVSP